MSSAPKQSKIICSAVATKMCQCGRDLINVSKEPKRILHRQQNKLPARKQTADLMQQKLIILVR